MSSPRSSAMQTGCPACTNATSEFVVPRSIPTARVLHPSFIRDCPGSEIWNSASTGMGPAFGDGVVVRLHLVQKTPVVAEGGQLARGLLHPVGRRLRQPGR